MSHVTYPAHLIVLDLIILLPFGQKYKLGSIVLCNCTQSPVASSLSATNSSQHPILKYPQALFLLWEHGHQLWVATLKGTPNS
jgi:hypothetical protein